MHIQFLTYSYFFCKEWIKLESNIYQVYLSGNVFWIK